MTSTEVDLLPELLEKITLNSYDPGNSYWVDVTYINNPLSFYVRPTAYRQFIDKLQAHEDPFKPEDVQIRGSVVFNSKTQNKPVRGTVIFIESKEDKITCDIFAPDYGFFEKSVDMKDIFKPKFHNIPPLAIHCQLADCKPIGETWTGKELDAMKCYVGEERAKLFVREKSAEVLTVELINSMPDDIATMLALTGYTTMGYGENVISRLTAPECLKLFFTHRELKPDDILHVRLQAGKELNAFFVAEKSDYKYFLNERENFTYFTKQLKVLSFEELAVDNAVSLFMDSSYKYERGIIREVLSENRARIQLVDWGNIVEGHISSMKPMSDRFYYYNATALFCSVEEDQMAEPGLLKYLYPGYEFRVQITEVGDGFEKPNIVKILK